MRDLAEYDALGKSVVCTCELHWVAGCCSFGLSEPCPQRGIALKAFLQIGPRGSYNAEQAPCHMLFPLACEVRLREYVAEFESSFEGTEEDKKDRTLSRVSESPFAGCGEEVSPRKRGCDEDGEGQGGHRRPKRQGLKIESFASDPRPVP